MLLYYDAIYRDIAYSIAMAAEEHKSHFELTKVTSYLDLAGEIWGVYCENLKFEIDHIIVTKWCRVILALTGKPVVMIWKEIHSILIKPFWRKLTMI